ncbi:hypothetical protein H1R20_g15201, partial [Candolleomyces eurysporus]
MTSSPPMGRTPSGSGLNGSFRGSESSPTPSRRGSRWVLKHEKYYMVGGDLFVLIDDVLFKIHSYFFQREARTFFDDPPANGAAPEPAVGDAKGRSEDRPIRILDVTVEEFEQFLWVFYNPRYDIYDAPIASWFSILRLAHRWDFPVVKDFALRELKRREKEVPLVTRIRLYQDHGAPPEYLVPLYGELCSRDLTPTEEEATELGFERMYRVFKARELLRSPADASGNDPPLSPLPEGMTEEETYPTIEKVFGLPPYVLGDGDDGLNGGGEGHGRDKAAETPQLGEEVPIINAPNPEKNKKDRTTKKRGKN